MVPILPIHLTAVWWADRTPAASLLLRHWQEPFLRSLSQWPARASVVISHWQLNKTLPCYSHILPAFPWDTWVASNSLLHQGPVYSLQGNCCCIPGATAALLLHWPWHLQGLFSLLSPICYCTAGFFLVFNLPLPEAQAALFSAQLWPAAAPFGASWSWLWSDLGHPCMQISLPLPNTKALPHKPRFYSELLSIYTIYMRYIL